jgi:hypothetical protein
VPLNFEINRMTFNWTDEAKAELQQCVADGLTATEVAAQFGFTYRLNISRNAIISKASRLKLVWKRSPANFVRHKNPQAEKPRRARPKRRGPPAWHQPPAQAAAPATAPEPLRAIPPAPNSKPVDLMGLTNATCRWPLWSDESPERLYCGAPEADMGNGVPYCPYHTAAALGRAYTRQERFEFNGGPRHEARKA